MSNREAARLGFRLLGIYIFAEALPITTRWLFSLGLYLSPPNPNPQSPFPFFRRSMTRYGVIAEGVSSILLLGLATVLIVWCRQLAERTFEQETRPSSTERTLGLGALAYSAIGLYLFTSRVPELVRATSDIADRNLSIGMVWIGAMLPPLLTVVIGLALFFGSHGLVRTWSRLRYSGLRRHMGLCIHCGYDLTGNTSGRCPECGTPLANAPPPMPQVLMSDSQMTNLESQAPSANDSSTQN